MADFGKNGPSQRGVALRWQNEDWELRPEKVVYWPRREALLLADTHFGKVSHFRKAGMPVPQQAAQRNFRKLDQLLKHEGLREVYFLGDLFHSELNTEWLALQKILQQYPQLHFHLIAGNHDILHGESYARLGMQVHQEPHPVDHLWLRHHPPEEEAPAGWCGHIHPAVRLRGMGRQVLKLASFYFRSQQAILPAFGEFTGMHVMPVQRKSTVAVTDSKAVWFAHRGLD